MTKSAHGPKRGGCWQWSIPTLIRRAVGAKTEDGYWRFVRVLHWRGSREVLNAASELCGSAEPKMRALGADILAQLGVPERSFPADALGELRALLATEDDPRVLESVLTAFSHAQENDDPTGVAQIASYSNHRSADVRYAVVWALLGHEDPESIATLVKLSSDADENVRDWATFGLGSQVDVDTPEVREALWARCHDVHDDTAAEALVGLAKRRDKRAGAVLRLWLERDDPGTLIFEAAEELGDPSVLPLLRHHLQQAEQEQAVDPTWLRSLTTCIEGLSALGSPRENGTEAGRQ